LARYFKRKKATNFRKITIYNRTSDLNLLFKNRFKLRLISLLTVSPVTLMGYNDRTCSEENRFDPDPDLDL